MHKTEENEEFQHNTELDLIQKTDEELGEPRKTKKSRSQIDLWKTNESGNQIEYETA